MRKNRLRFISLLVGAMLLAGCASRGQAGADNATTLNQQAPPAAAAFPSGSASSQQENGLQIPDFRTSEFHEAAAGGEDGVKIDLSAVSQGYVAVSAVNESRLKFQVICGESTYTYDLDKDGVPAIFPINCGNGTYQFRVMRNIGDSQYVVQYSTESAVVLDTEFEPFLRPSVMVDYSENSDCAVKARELAQGCASDAEMVSAVYGYLTKNVVYDYDKAASVKKGYLPDPDETLNSGKGICFDYAALAAAMLRCTGIPTRLMTGYVGETYHAWNAVYLQDRGWITVEIEAVPEKWQRFDATFAANGVDASFLTNDANYVDRYIY